MEQILNTFSYQFIIFYVIFIGLCIGSFINVVVFRLPVMLHRSWTTQAKDILDNPLDIDKHYDEETINLILPRSRCPKCKHIISWYHNLPIVSWLYLKGKCGYCSQPISARYPIVEAVSCALTLATFFTFGLSIQFFLALIFTWCLLALTLIDFDTMLLPDNITLPLLWLGLVVNCFGHFTSIESAVLGAVVGYLSLWSLYHAFRLLTGKEGMGYGDFKLLAAMGAWLGWHALPDILILSSITGIVYSIFCMIYKKQLQSSPIPFGPFLACAGWLKLVFGVSILAAVS